MPPEEPPPLEPPAEGRPPPPELPPELLCDPPEDPPPLEPPLEPDEPPEEPDEPPLELGLDGIEDEEDCCWAHPPMRNADTELMAMQCMAIVNNLRVVGDDAPVAGCRVV
jgi:hypothetical protein